MKQFAQAELVLDAQAALGESALWRAETQSLHWVDIVAGEIHTLQTQSREHTFVCVGQTVGAIVPAKDGGFGAAMRAGFYLADDKGRTRRIVQPEGLVPNFRFNDGKCDRRGRFWGGTQIICKEMEGKGYFWCIDTDGSVRPALTGVTTSNGLAWNAGDTVLYYIDTPTRVIMAFDFDLEQGTLGEGKPCVEVPREFGSPDGMTIDREGMLWVAHWGGSAVRRYNPHTGECTAVLPVPASKVTSCCFGGPALDTLYITTARMETDAEKEPLAGGIFKADVGAKGCEAFSLSDNLAFFAE